MLPMLPINLFDMTTELEPLISGTFSDKDFWDLVSLALTKTKHKKCHMHQPILLPTGRLLIYFLKCNFPTRNSDQVIPGNPQFFRRFLADCRHIRNYWSSHEQVEGFERDSTC